MNKEIDITWTGKVNPEVKKMIEDNVRAVVKPFIEKNETLRAELARVKADLDELVEANRWIPVGERMPEKNGEYLVRSSYRDETFISTCEYHPIPSGAGWRTVSWVTHWRPLPEPPNDQPQPGATTS